MAKRKENMNLATEIIWGMKKTAYHLPDCADYLTGREYHSGSSIDFQVR